MIDYKNLTNNRPTINYDTTTLTIQGYELKFALDVENSDLEEVINWCEKNNWPHKIIYSAERQRHVWVKGWIGE